MPKHITIIGEPTPDQIQEIKGKLGDDVVIIIETGALEIRKKITEFKAPPLLEKCYCIDPIEKPSHKRPYKYHR